MRERGEEKETGQYLSFPLAAADLGVDCVADFDGGALFIFDFAGHDFFPLRVPIRENGSFDGSPSRRVCTRKS